MKAFMKVVATLLLVIGTLACSSAPSESEAKKFLDEQGLKSGQYRVVALKKTNAKISKDLYSLEYEANLECMVAEPSYGAFRDHRAFGDFSLMNCDKVGRRIAVHGTINFEITENG
jgi:hypothetical protein